eukprot:365319-Chlamydomonas_euryale.AAC.14
MLPTLTGPCSHSPGSTLKQPPAQGWSQDRVPAHVPVAGRPGPVVHTPHGLHRVRPRMGCLHMCLWQGDQAWLLVPHTAAARNVPSPQHPHTTLCSAKQGDVDHASQAGYARQLHELSVPAKRVRQLHRPCAQAAPCASWPVAGWQSTGQLQQPVTHAVIAHHLQSLLHCWPGGARHKEFPWSFLICRVGNEQPSPALAVPELETKDEERKAAATCSRHGVTCGCGVAGLKQPYLAKQLLVPAAGRVTQPLPQHIRRAPPVNGVAQGSRSHAAVATALGWTKWHVAHAPQSRRCWNAQLRSTVRCGTVEAACHRARQVTGLAPTAHRNRCLRDAACSDRRNGAVLQQPHAVELVRVRVRLHRKEVQAAHALLAVLPVLRLLDRIGRRAPRAVPPALVDARLQHEARAVDVRLDCRDVEAIGPRGQRQRAAAEHGDACGWGGVRCGMRRSAGHARRLLFRAQHMRSTVLALPGEAQPRHGACSSGRSPGKARCLLLQSAFALPALCMDVALESSCTTTATTTTNTKTETSNDNNNNDDKL